MPYVVISQIQKNAVSLEKDRLFRFRKNFFKEKRWRIFFCFFQKVVSFDHISTPCILRDGSRERMLRYDIKTHPKRTGFRSAHIVDYYYKKEKSQ